MEFTGPLRSSYTVRVVSILTEGAPESCVGIRFQGLGEYAADAILKTFPAKIVEGIKEGDLFDVTIEERK